MKTDKWIFIIWVIAAVFVLVVAVASLQAQQVQSAVCATQYNASPWTPVSDMTKCNASSGPNFVVSSGVDVLGYCPIGGTYPEAGVVGSAFCGTYKPISASVGGYDQNGYGFGVGRTLGEVWGNNVLLGIPGNPATTEKTTCWLQIFNSEDQMGPC